MRRPSTEYTASSTLPGLASANDIVAVPGVGFGHGENSSVRVGRSACVAWAIASAGSGRFAASRVITSPSRIAASPWRSARKVTRATSPSPEMPEPRMPSSAASTVPGCGISVTPPCCSMNTPTADSTGSTTEASQASAAEKPWMRPAPCMRSTAVTTCPASTSDGA